MKRLNLRIALVIEETESLRRSVVQLLRSQGWIVHGIRRAEQALPLLRHIPYALIVIDSERSSMSAIEFARILHKSEEGQAIQLVAIIDSPGRSSGDNLMECGAFLARKRVWREDLSKFFTNIERSDNDGPTLALRGATQHLVGQR